MTIPSNPTFPVCHRTKYTRELRDRIRAELGNHCVRCESTEDLQMDCREPVGSAHHAMSWFARIRFYHCQHMVGNLQLLCPGCHQVKTFEDIRNGIYSAPALQNGKLLEREANS